MRANLRDQIALVTGASGAIGGAIARSLALEGARLVLVGRDASALSNLAESLRGSSPEIDVQAVDLGDDAKVRRLVTRTLGSFGGVDLLIHSAGVFTAGTLEATTMDELDRQWRINTRAPYLLTQLMLPSLRTRRGQVVFINSTSGIAARGSVSAYAASKFGLRAVADALRDEVNGDGVRVLSVYPGRTASRMQQEVRKIEGKDYDPTRLMQPGDVAEAVVAALALPRTAEITEIHLRPMRKA